MSNIHLLLKLIPLFPLAACLFTLLLGKRVLKERAHWPTVLAIGASFACSVLLCASVRNAIGEKSRPAATGFETTTTLWTWLNLDAAEKISGTDKAFAIDITLRADPLTSIMLCMVTFVATLVAIYAAGYMHGDPGYARFFTYVSLFVFSMTMLVSVSNFALLYVFWEAVGVCSYLLIGFWYQKPSAAAAGKKAFLVNRVGDFGFALGLFLIWTTYGTLNFHDTAAADGQPQVAGVLGQERLAHPEQFAAGGVATAICLLLMLGACGKSAQFPLHVWLPDAMEGPTPVSALIHAATMVTAGVYMVARCTPLFHASPDAQMVVAIVGAFTALLSGLIALTQTDLKRVMAYSTVSQLGYMFLSMGTGSLLGITAGMFHLFTHAFFKALLFLGSGSVMHAMGGVIDMRRFGGLRKLMPITHGTFLFGCLALAGIVPFAGFWSKDLILDAVHERMHHSGHALLFGMSAITAERLFEILYYSALVTAGLTAFYTFRAFFMTFYGDEKIPHEAGHHAHESPWKMTGPLCVLALCALCVGAYFELTHTFADFIHQTPSLAYGPVAKTAPEKVEFNQAIAIASTGAAIVGICLAAYLYLGTRAQAEWLAAKLRPAYVLSYGKFFIDQIYVATIVKPLEFLAALLYWLDRYLVDGLVNWIGAIPPLVGSLLRGLQAGLVQSYALLMIVGGLIALAALRFWSFG